MRRRVVSPSSYKGVHGIASSAVHAPAARRAPSMSSEHASSSPSGHITLNNSLSTSSSSSSTRLDASSNLRCTDRSHTRRTFATMANNTNEACCTIPPVKSDYTPKGSMEKVGGLDCYAIGPKDSKKAIIVVYDIFGFWPTTKQGADILAEATKARVVMPDFFRGKPIAQEDYPPDTQEKKDAFQAFFGAQGDFQARKPDADAVADALRKDGASKIGIMGFCWGGKFSVLNGGEGSKYAAVAQIHPAMVDPKDAEKLTVPIANFPSKDEPKEDVEKFEAEVQKKPFASECEYKTYPENHHGWASARADLKDETNFKAFQDVYQRLANFFNKQLA